MAEKCIERIPSYFYKVGASSTGKYHPKFASGEGGLYRHTIAACMILESLFELAPYDSLSTLGRDTARLAVMLHDTCKSGMSDKEYASNKHTRFEHPMLPRALYGDLVKEWNGLGSGIIEHVDV